MGFWDKLRGEFVDVIEWTDDSSDTMVYRFERYGNEIYNFKGLAFHKSKYRGSERSVYFASNSGFFMSNDVYLAFLTSDIANSYFATMGRLFKGVVKEMLQTPKAMRKEAKADVKANVEGTKPNGSKG